MQTIRKMKKLFLSFLILGFFISCTNKFIFKRDNENYQLTTLEKKFENKLSPFLNINFENNFSDDKVKILVDSNLVYDKTIKTNNIIGIADSYRLENDFNSIVIIINDRKLILKRKNLKKFKNIYINKLQNNRFEVLVSNKIHFYK